MDIPLISIDVVMEQSKKNKSGIPQLVGLIEVRLNPFMII
jgi:hypothetical protein